MVPEDCLAPKPRASPGAVPFLRYVFPGFRCHAEAEDSLSLMTKPLSQSRQNSKGLPFQESSAENEEGTEIEEEKQSCS